MEEEIQLEEKKTRLEILGQIFRILFYLTLLYLLWRFLPFSFSSDEIDLSLKGITTMAGTVLLALSILYSSLTPHEEDYENWGWFAIWITLGVGALYGVTFLL